ncbi:tRNA epoxyqueuosine(34) reductase QueG [Calditrichota bacterium]
MTLINLTQSIKEILFEEGFHKVGITSFENPSKSNLLEKWLINGFQGDMSWMENHKEKRKNILQFFPETKSIISVAHNYYSPEKHSNRTSVAKISRYAWGEDYHRIMKKKLKKALIEIKKLEKINGRICVDTAPIMEKLWAEKAGIGWQGKHTNIITKEFGSWVFLGEILIDRELVYDNPVEDFCGKCTKCIDFCPTNAIIAPYVLDSNRCISYLTIEYGDKPIPKNLAPKMQNWIFGCDICQDVCPWNKFQKTTDEQRYFPNKANVKSELKELENIAEKEYTLRFKKSPLSRLGWKNFIRNVKTVKNSQ